MRLDELVEIGADEPVFETGLLLAGNIDPVERGASANRLGTTPCGCLERSG